MGAVLATVALGPAAGAAAAIVPQAGDWEGTGPHGLPLSFELVRRGSHLLATSLAVGDPASCPAVARDSEAVPLEDPAYVGPGGASGTGALSSSPAAVLAGRIPQSGQRVSLGGSFSSGRSGSFSVQISKQLGCGWPAKTLTWAVHRAARRRVGDGTWSGPLTATGLINGNVRLVVGAQGRVVDSFTSFFTCLTDTQQGNTTFRAVPAYEFISPGGDFTSPLNGGSVGHHPTTWAGRFAASGQLTGHLTIFDDCTNQMIRANFTARRTKPAG
jgi:hypothetical protein